MPVLAGVGIFDNQRTFVLAVLLIGKQFSYFSKLIRSSMQALFICVLALSYLRP